MKAVARLTRLACALAAAAPVVPSPGSANTQSSFDPVVRIEGSVPSTGGTGTLIGSRQVGDSYGMVFLAADHTLERVGPLATVGFGDIGSPKLDLSLGGALDVTVDKLGPDGTEDMALIGVTIDLSTLTASQRSYLTGVSPVGVTAAPSPYAPFAVQDFGFGKSGPIVTYGTQQTFNNIIDSYISFNGSYTTDMNNNPLVYMQEMERWTYNDPNTGDWIPGEGAGYAGFSGSPLLISSGSTPYVQGIQSSGSDAVNLAQSIGLRFTPAYVDWIQGSTSTYLATVPEPGTGSLVLLGLLGLCRPRSGRLSWRRHAASGSTYASSQATRP